MPAEPHYTVEPPQFRPTTTLSGGVGGGFGTGGGFGSTGGFHTQRLQPWEEPKRVDTGPGAPFDVPKLSKWAPSVCATAAAHAVNKLRAETDDNPDVRAVVDEKALAAALKAEAEGGEYVMEPERYAFLRVQVPAPRLVQPPPGLEKQKSGALLHPAERRAMLEYEKQKAIADEVLGHDKHRQMRAISLMHRRFPSGVVGVESAASEGTIVYAATRRKMLREAQHGAVRRQNKMTWILNNSRSEPHLGYDFLRAIPADFVPPEGAKAHERKLWDTKGRAPPGSIPDTFTRVVQSASAPEEEVDDKAAFHAARSQHLRNKETEGRAFNIITGTRLETLPPSIPEDLPRFPRKNHPSMNPGPEPAHVTWKDPRS